MSALQKRPEVVVFAGPNGSEKNTFTEKELEELERARNMPITFDEDSPETTLEKAVKFRRVNPPRQQKKMNLV